MDSPETVHPYKEVEPFGPEASAFTKRMLSARRVRLELDHRRLYDRYGRLRAYVFTMDGKMVNRELVEHGYARVVDTIRFRYYSDFKRREHQAKRAGVGLWARR